MQKKHDIEFEILRDEGNQVAEAFGLRQVLPEYLREVYEQFNLDLPRVNGDESWSLPMPARYVVDRKGIVFAADVNADYTKRPEPEKTIEDLRRLQEQK